MGNKTNKEKKSESNALSSKSKMDKMRSMFQRNSSSYERLINEPEEPPKIPPRYVNVVTPELPPRTHPDQIKLIDL